MRHQLSGERFRKAENSRARDSEFHELVSADEKVSVEQIVENHKSGLVLSTRKLGTSRLDVAMYPTAERESRREWKETCGRAIIE